MGDTNYQTGVYLKQGADEFVVADGGQITVEDGGELEIESGGDVSGESGGTLTAKDGFSFYFKDSSQAMTAQQMLSVLWAKTQHSVIANTAGVLSVTNLPSVGTIIFSMADAASNASAWFTSMAGVVGMQLILFMRGVGSTGSVYISTSGVSIVGTTSGDISSISIQNSAASSGRLTLVCTDTDEWSIMDKSAVGIVEQAST